MDKQLAQDDGESWQSKECFTLIHSFNTLTSTCWTPGTGSGREDILGVMREDRDRELQGAVLAGAAPPWVSQGRCPEAEPQGQGEAFTEKAQVWNRKP